ncbi:MAG: hypothetical protein MUF04_13315 [Akkermansiaceae bacterium]|nr:hypothetical protein [Akkermansiaceae bacterium]
MVRHCSRNPYLRHVKSLEDTIRLPGTTDDNHKGIRTDYRPVDRLARVWDWKGAAWYQREVNIPESWGGKRVTLFLERTKHSRLWVNDTFVAWENSLSAQHVFDITQAVSPGTHTLTLLIDNSKLPPVGPSHAVDERTQTNWNGIIGRIELRATDPVWIEDLQVYPNAARRESRVVITLGNLTGKAATGTLTVTGASRNVTGVLRARNYETFRDRLQAAGILDQAGDFVKVSGALAAICYREEIEAALRTPEFGGFQLLDIMDFPGQGTAPVGMLDGFMDNKGILQPEEWRGFCSETVPLLRIEKYTWTQDETFTAKVQVAHYGPAAIPDAVVSAELLGIPGGVIRFSLPTGSWRRSGSHRHRSPPRRSGTRGALLDHLASLLRGFVLRCGSPRGLRRRYFQLYSFPAMPNLQKIREIRER